MYLRCEICGQVSLTAHPYEGYGLCELVHGRMWEAAAHTLELVVASVAVAVLEWVVAVPKWERLLLRIDACCLNRVMFDVNRDVQLHNGSDFKHGASSMEGRDLFMHGFGAALNARVYLAPVRTGWGSGVGWPVLVFRGAQGDEACVDYVQMQIRHGN